jgi:hypothetical protein
LVFYKLFKRNDWGVLKYSRGEFEKVVKDGFIKKRRYAFKSNNAINYGAHVRMRERTDIIFKEDGTIDREVFEYKDRYVADAMFGSVVMDPLKDAWYSGKLSFRAATEEGVSEDKTVENASFAEYLNSDNARDRILKNVCRAGLAAQVKAHRSRTGTGERWSPEMVRNFYDSLRSMPQYIEYPPGSGKEIPIKGSQFFSKEDIEWIKEQSGTTDGELLFENSLEVGVDMLKMFPEIFGIFFKNVIA